MLLGWQQQEFMILIGTKKYWAISEKLRQYGVSIKYLGITVLSLLVMFCGFTAISVPQCINIHIKCSVVRLEVSHRPKFT